MDRLVQLYMAYNNGCNYNWMYLLILGYMLQILIPNSSIVETSVVQGHRSRCGRCGGCLTKV